MHICTLTDTHQTAVLSVMYLTAIGFVMVFYGIIIDSTSAIPGFVNFNYTNLLFAGGFLTTIFWVCFISVKRERL